MKALVLEEYMKLTLQDRPDPRPAAGEVLVRVKACGICGSDVHGLDGSTGRRIPPLVMGHEAAGLIVAVADGVSGWAPGDRVTFDSTISCGQCWYCRRSLTNLCDNRLVLGVSCDEYKQDGAFAEYVTVPARILYRLPDAVSYERAVMIEPLSVALHAVRRTPVSPGDTGVVVGAGMIGLLVIQVLRRAGCAKIVALDVDPDRLSLARTLGADLALPSDSKAAERVRELTDGRGADVAFEVVGISAAMATAFSCLRKGGALTLIGNLSPSVEMALQATISREITFRGSYASGGEYPACIELIERGDVNVDAFLSAVAPLAEGPAWFKRLYAREKGLMKVVLTP